MSYLIVVLGAVLMAAGLGSLWASLNLSPTDMGLMYGVCGTTLIGFASVVLALAAILRRLERPSHGAAPLGPASAARLQPAGDLVAADTFSTPSTEPSATQPKIVGRHETHGAKYVIYSDGGIEAETSDGVYRFGSMADFRSFIAGRRA